MKENTMNLSNKELFSGMKENTMNLSNKELFSGMKENTYNYNPDTIYDYKKDIIIIFLNPHFLKSHIDIKNEITNISNKFSFKILYITEPISFLIEKKVYEEMIKIIRPCCLWTYTYENFNKLNTNIKMYRIIPRRYELLDKLDKSYDKDIRADKIVFFGNINGIREDVCRLFGDNLINITDAWTIEDWQPILREYLFYLNVHRRKNCLSFEAFRIVPILFNGGIVISENINQKEQRELSEFNIYFTDRNNIINVFNEVRQNIQYDIIYQKMVNFRKYLSNICTNERLC